MREEDVDDVGTEQESVEGETAETLSEKLVHMAPWWLISVGIHIVALLAFTLINIEHIAEASETTTIISIKGVEIEQKPADLEQVKDLLKPEPDQELFFPTNEPNDDPIIYFPGALPSDHNESANNDPIHHSMKGDSKDFLSYLPGEGGGIRGRGNTKGPGIYDSMGVGGGGGGGAGRYGGRFGGMHNLRKVTGVTESNLNAVTQGLLWLARHQNDDGSWSAGLFSKNCSGSVCPGIGVSSYDVGITGLAVWAFLCRGYVHTSTDTFTDPVTKKQVSFGKVVQNAINWLLKVQTADGCFGDKSGHFMYNHAIASLAMIEAFGMTQAPRLKDPAQKAVNFTIDAQNPGKGWRYSARPGDNDSSVTGWCTMVLKSAEMSGLNFPPSANQGAITWFDEVTETTYGRVGYTGLNEVAIRQNEKAAFDSGNLVVQPSLTAIGILSRIMLTKKKDDPAIKNGAAMLIDSLPAWDTSKPGVLDFYYWYYGTLALFQYDGPNGPSWKKWNDAISKALLPTQATAKDGCKCGSWDSDPDRWGSEGGRVYATAINVLTLEIYYRYPSVFSKSDSDKK